MTAADSVNIAIVPDIAAQSATSSYGRLLQDQAALARMMSALGDDGGRT